jgi:hypothetical protein
LVSMAGASPPGKMMTAWMEVVDAVSIRMA